MSEHAPAAESPELHIKPGTAVSSPEFDRQEIASFGKDDSHAIQAIGKMLVGFFFYSLLVMLVVAVWTMSRGGQLSEHTADSHQSEEHANEF